MEDPHFVNFLFGKNLLGSNMAPTLSENLQQSLAKNLCTCEGMIKHNYLGEDVYRSMFEAPKPGETFTCWFLPIVLRWMSLSILYVSTNPWPGSMPTGWHSPTSTMTLTFMGMWAAHPIWVWMSLLKCSNKITNTANQMPISPYRPPQEEP